MTEFNLLTRIGTQELLRESVPAGLNYPPLRPNRHPTCSRWRNRQME